MTTFTSRYHDLTNALVTVWDANITDLPVFDGPPVSAESLREFLAVGWSLDPENIDAGSFRQDIRTDAAASASYDETIRINCGLQVWDGNGSVAATRARAWAYMGDVERVLKNAVNTLSVTGLIRAGVADARIVQEAAPEGFVVSVQFTVEGYALVYAY